MTLLGVWFFGKDHKRRLADLELGHSQDKRRVANIDQEITDLKRERAHPVQVTNIAYLGETQMPQGDVAEIRVMSREEFDVLPEKKDKTLYLICEE